MVRPSSIKLNDPVVSCQPSKDSVKDTYDLSSELVELIGNQTF